ncbi:hypothetical protein N5C23_07885 [Stutzerimonas stutzeri]|uniref:hypothetical protein n=1 Tax=Stutzerimonas stutzeri TaxID=316 RepID=UPI00244AF078|nr:hypothetical protein [Stutzerimonas stutzeri]MDH0184299.1 hypothetical protein [Stutzerimonas stutzeri]MDH1248237.1 hypothetical protein [Stutzerimonas stutzeri]
MLTHHGTERATEGTANGGFGVAAGKGGGAEQAGGQQENRGVLHGVIPYEELRRDPHVPLRFRQGLPDEMRDPVPVC